MSLFMEIETDRKLPFDARKIAELVIETSLDYVKCPYETEVSLLLTTDEEIKEINRMQRQIDRATDVLSFPMADYETPGDFSHLDEDAGLFHPDTGELMLGDIVISVDKVFEQAEEYGHSLLREYAFLIAHSMLHLFGYDHMEDKCFQVRDHWIKGEQLWGIHRQIKEKKQGEKITSLKGRSWLWRL